MATTTKRPRFEYGLLGSVYYKGTRIGYVERIGTTWAGYAISVLGDDDAGISAGMPTRYAAARSILEALGEDILDVIAAAR